MSKEEATAFLGHDIDYWLELKARADNLNISELIEDICQLRGKVSFYEHHIWLVYNASIKDVVE